MDVAVEMACDVGESPCWDAETGSLLFVDITPGRIHRLDTRSGHRSSFEVGQEAGAVVLGEEGGMVIAARDGIIACGDDGRNPLSIADIDADHPERRMNDAKCDPQGRLWAGTMAFDLSAGVASLYRVDRGVVMTVLTGVTLSNGLGWSPDGTVMYFVDSMTYSIQAFDFDGSAGSIEHLRCFVRLDPAGGLPDGLCVDQEGGVWVALMGGGEVRRYDASGALTDTIRLPVRQVTSCAFGGSDLSEMFITTAAYRMSPAERRAEPLAGSVFTCEPGVRGLPATPYRVR